MITFENVSLDYACAAERGHAEGRINVRPALEDVSFSLEPGAFTFLTGHSGAGKSSLLRLIARLERPSAGEIRIGNIRYSTLKPRQVPALRRQMGLIFQDNRLLLDRDVFENVALPLIIGRYSRREILQRVPAALDRVGLAERHAANPSVLSGGEQQRIGIARALVARPKLLLADEPTGNLDADMSEEIMGLLLDFNASGVSVVLATHDTTLLATHRLPRLTLHGGRLDAPGGAGDAPRRATLRSLLDD